MNSNFAVIGLGRIGRAMLSLLQEAGHPLQWAVSSREHPDLRHVSTSLPAEPGGAEIVLIAVPDTCIAQTAHTIAEAWKGRCQGITFFHFSGLHSSELLAPLSRLGAHTGSLHPLQSVSAAPQAYQQLKGCPLTVEGSPPAIVRARKLAATFGGKISVISTQDKVIYHTAAVIASNYLVIIENQARELFSSIGLDFSALLPLIKGTLSNIEAQGPKALTGPVARGDWDTVREHINLLSRRYPDMLASYLSLGHYAAHQAGRTWPQTLGKGPAVLEREALVSHAARLKERGLRLVFTNGCFDILHAGHVSYLERARALGDCLIVGLNSDASIRKLGKGEERPLNDQASRARVLASLACVSYVTIFYEETPYELIETLRPQVLVKGGDWKVADIVGADIVRASGGEVVSLPFVDGYSTTSLVERIRRS